MLTLGAVVVGNWVPGSPLEGAFSLTKGQTVFALCTYGFVASVLPGWMLLAPRDYLSSFLKIGTVVLLIGGVFVANPVLPCPLVNPVFKDGGPTFAGGLFPFVFICIMCGSISGFHALVSSGTTPKMIDKETQVRPIGYGAMLMEGLVGVVALIAAASLEPKLYYDINVSLDTSAKWQKDLDRLYVELGNVEGPAHLPVENKRNLDDVERMVGGESLRGRVGGAVTLAVGMSDILTNALSWTNDPGTVRGLMKYWYHFAIMFEALFILTLPLAGGARQGVPAVREDRLGAGRRPGHDGRDRGLGRAGLHRLHRHDLADVRHRQPAPGGGGAGAGDDAAGEHGPRPLRPDHGAADAVRYRDDDDRRGRDGRGSLPGHDQRRPRTHGRAEHGDDGFRDRLRLHTAAVRHDPLGAGGARPDRRSAGRLDAAGG